MIDVNALSLKALTEGCNGDKTITGVMDWKSKTLKISPGTTHWKTMFC